MLNYQRVPQFLEIITSETGDLCKKGVDVYQQWRVNHDDHQPFVPDFQMESCTSKRVLLVFPVECCRKSGGWEKEHLRQHEGV
jgi:hypothetical protein